MASTPAPPLHTLPTATAIAHDVYPELGTAWPADGVGSIALVAAQLPDPKQLPEGSVVVVHDRARPPSTWWARAARMSCFWLRTPTAHRAVRCTALLALGYRDVGMAQDPRTREEVAWGVAATSGRFS